MIDLSVVTTMTNPEDRNDPWKEALDCYNQLADELVVAVLISLVPLIIPIPLIFLGLFTSAIQALIFAQFRHAPVCRYCRPCTAWQRPAVLYPRSLAVKTTGRR